MIIFLSLGVLAALTTLGSGLRSLQQARAVERRIQVRLKQYASR